MSSFYKNNMNFNDHKTFSVFYLLLQNNDNVNNDNLRLSKQRVNSDLVSTIVSELSREWITM